MWYISCDFCEFFQVLFNQDYYCYNHDQYLASERNYIAVCDMVAVRINKCMHCVRRIPTMAVHKGMDSIKANSRIN